MNAKSALEEAEYRLSKLISELNRAHIEVEMLRGQVEKDPKPDRWADVRAAYEHGEKCQMRVRHQMPVSGKMWGKWQDNINPAFPDDPDIEFRVKPPKRYRPFIAEEVPLGKIVKKKEGCGSYLITASECIANEVCWVFTNGKGSRADDLLTYCTFEDGTPCGVEVEEEQ